MDKENIKLHNGKLRKPIKILDKVYYIKLLSVYEMLLCERLAQSLVVKFINEGSERISAQSIADNLCLCMMCLVNDKDEQVFNNTKIIMNTFTSDELVLVIDKYNEFRKEYMGFEDLNEESIQLLKKN